MPDAIITRLEGLIGTTEGVLDSLRRLAMNLRPGALDRAGLIPAIRQFIQAYKDQTGLAVEFESVGLDDHRLPADVETNLYRLTQEALTNIARHAQSTAVGVLLEERDGRLSLIIEDDGVGFDLQEAFGKGHLGLVGMRERAEMMGGCMIVDQISLCSCA